MNLEPFLQADRIVKIHAVLALLALLLGALQLALKKGTVRHKFLGRIWVLALFVVALSSFFIHEIRLMGPFSPIHLLSALVLYTLVQGMLAVRAGDIAKHEKEMKVLYGFGLILAGVFTLMPGRIFYRVLTG